MNPPPSGFGPMGFNPFGMPPWMWQMMQSQEKDEIHVPDVIVPARVEKALQFFAMASQKTADRAAISESQIEIIPGQKLIDEETCALATACNLLTKYFGGALPHDVWEKLRYEAQAKQLANSGNPGHLLHCFVCAKSGRAQANCELCNGSGFVLVSAANQSSAPNGGQVDQSNQP